LVGQLTKDSARTQDRPTGVQKEMLYKKIMRVSGANERRTLYNIAATAKKKSNPRSDIKGT